MSQFLSVSLLTVVECGFACINGFCLTWRLPGHPPLHPGSPYGWAAGRGAAPMCGCPGTAVRLLHGELAAAVEFVDVAKGAGQIAATMHREHKLPRNLGPTVRQCARPPVERAQSRTPAVGAPDGVGAPPGPALVQVPATTSCNRVTAASTRAGRCGGRARTTAAAAAARSSTGPSPDAAWWTAASASSASAKEGRAGNAGDTGQDVLRDARRVPDVQDVLDRVEQIVGIHHHRCRDGGATGRVIRRRGLRRGGRNVPDR